MTGTAAVGAVVRLLDTAIPLDTAIEEGRGLSSMSGILADTGYRLPSAAGPAVRRHFRCRPKNRFPSSASNHGVPAWPPRLACSVFSLLPKASNRSRARCRGFP
jgi:hypothetical protein